MPRPRSSTFYLPLAPQDAPLSLKAKLSVLPPSAANALLAPRARTIHHDTDSKASEDECARLERVLGCGRTGGKYRPASPEFKTVDWSSPASATSPAEHSIHLPTTFASLECGASPAITTTMLVDVALTAPALPIGHPYAVSDLSSTYGQPQLSYLPETLSHTPSPTLKQGVPLMDEMALDLVASRPGSDLDDSSVASSCDYDGSSIASSPSTSVFDIVSRPLSNLPHGWHAVVAIRPRLSSPLSLACWTQRELEDDAITSPVEYPVSSDPLLNSCEALLPMDCRAYLHQQCRMPLPPPPPPSPPAEQSDAKDSAMPVARQRYRTATPIYKRVLRKSLGSSAWQRSELLRAARAVEEASAAGVLDACAPGILGDLSFGDYLSVAWAGPLNQTDSTVEFCGGGTFWDNEEFEAESGDFEPCDFELEEDEEANISKELQEVLGRGLEEMEVDNVLFEEETEMVRELVVDADGSRHLQDPTLRSPELARMYLHGRSYDRLSAGSQQMALENQEDDEEEVFRYSPLHELEQTESRLPMQEEPMSLEQGSQLDTQSMGRKPSPSVSEGGNASDEYLDSEFETDDRMISLDDIISDVSSSASSCTLSPTSPIHSSARVFLKEIPASPLATSFASAQPSAATSRPSPTCSPTVSPFGGWGFPPSSDQSFPPTPASAPILLAPAPKHAWALNSIRNALTSSVNSLVDIARSRSPSPLPWGRISSPAPAPSLEEMVAVPHSRSCSPHSQPSSCATPTPSDLRDLSGDADSQSSTRTATPGGQSMSPTVPTMILSTPPKRTLSTSSLSSVVSEVSEGESESGSSAASLCDSGIGSCGSVASSTNGFSRSPSPDFGGEWETVMMTDAIGLTPPMLSRKTSSPFVPSSSLLGVTGMDVIRPISPPMPGSWEPYDFEVEDGWGYSGLLRRQHV